LNPPDHHTLLPGSLDTLLRARGLETWAPLGGRDLEAGLASAPAAVTADILTLAKGAVVAALAYDPRPVPGPAEPGQPGGPQPYLRIAAFASSHRYAALARLLKAAAKDLSAATGYPYTAFRVAVNSRLPEKTLAERAGLGYRGRSDLLLSHAYGPACIIGVLFLPFDPLGSAMPGHQVGMLKSPEVKGLCENCKACAAACPGKAIDAGGDGRSTAYHRESCIQHWMSTLEEPPAGLRQAFSGRLYGCDACILACPLSAGAWRADRADGSSPASRADALLLPAERRPGSLISVPFLEQAGDPGLKAFFRKTALGLSWLGPGIIRRNTALGCFDPGS
jgi:epoxyqueuosine reductase QueG